LRDLEELIRLLCKLFIIGVVYKLVDDDIG